MKNKNIQNIKIVTLALILALGISYASAAWTPAPPPGPPQNNTDAPINVGGSSQTKIGPFNISTTSLTALTVYDGGTVLGYLVTGSRGIYSTGKIGVGISNPEMSIEASLPSSATFNMPSIGTSLANGTKWIYMSPNNADIIRSKNPLHFAVADTKNLAGFSRQMTIDTAGNVGIGTTTPAAKLEVVGTVRIVNGSQGAGKVLTSDATGLASWANPSSVPGSGGSSKWATSTINTANIHNGNLSGNVGIGTNNPTTKLEVAGPISTSGTISGLVLNNRATNAMSAQWYSPTAGETRLYDHPTQTDRLTINSAGNVGIGTTNPTTKLSVAGDGVANIVGATVGGRIQSGDSANTGGLWTNTANTQFIGDAHDSTGGAANSMMMWVNGQARLLVKPSGNIGIGTLTPTAKLEVSNGDVSAEPIVSSKSLTVNPATRAFYAWNSNYGPVSGAVQASRVFFNPTGYSQSMIDIYGPTAPTWLNGWGTEIYSAGPVGQTSGLNIPNYLILNAGGRKMLTSGDSDNPNSGYDSSLVVSSAGTVGIGKMPPSYLTPDGVAPASAGAESINPDGVRLDVNGTVQATGLKIKKNAGVGRVLVSDSEGNASWQDLDIQVPPTSFLIYKFGVKYGDIVRTDTPAKTAFRSWAKSQSGGGILPDGFRNDHGWYIRANNDRLKGTINKLCSYMMTGGIGLTGTGQYSGGDYGSDNNNEAYYWNSTTASSGSWAVENHGDNGAIDITKITCAGSGVTTEGLNFVSL